MASLYLITDARPSSDEFIRLVTDAFAGGVDVIELRSEGLSQAEHLDRLQLAQTIAYPYQGLVVVRDDGAIAQQFQADVLHLGAAGVDSSIARIGLSPFALIGRSVHDRSQLAAAHLDQDTNYVVAGPAFQSATAQYPCQGLELLGHMAENYPVATSKPCFAAGGINLENIDQVLLTGVRRVVVSKAVTQAADVKKAAQQLKAKIRQAWDTDPAMADYLPSIFGQQSEGLMGSTDES